MDKERQRIAELNDRLRCHGEGGRVIITSGVEALGTRAVANILAEVRAFAAFSPDNDPHVNGTRNAQFDIATRTPFSQIDVNQRRYRGSALF